MYKVFNQKILTGNLEPALLLMLIPENIIVRYKNLPINNPIKATDAYDIITFKSNLFKQINPLKI